MQDLRVIPVWAWFIIATLLLTQSILLFKDAQKEGVNPWFWGIWGLTNVPTVAIVYWLVVKMKKKR